MAGTVEGGKKTAAKNLAKNPNFYAELGRKGGRATGHKGFAVMAVEDPDRLRRIGMKGGSISRRGPAKRVARV